VTRKDFTQASREELIDLILAKHEQSEAAQSRLEEAEAQLRWFKQQIFGAKSERRVPGSEDPSQLCLGETLEPEERAEAPATTVRGHERKRRPQRETPDESGLRFDDTVPVETIEVPNPDLEGVDPAELEPIQEKVRYRLCQRPAAYFIKKYVYRTVKRRDTGEISTPGAPFAVLEKSYADVTLLAGLLVDKFRYHLPLYRQHQRMKAAGITVSRTSLTNWVHQSAALLEPIYEAQLASVLASAVLAMDETPIRAGRKQKGKMRTAYFWPIYGDRDEVVFPYASTRAHSHVEPFLEGFEGTLLSDGYAAYDVFAEKRAKVCHALCWAHARREFLKGEDVEPARVAQALEFIRVLYRVEDEIREKKLEGSAALQARAERSRPVVQAFFVWLEEELAGSALLPTNPFTKAARYALKRKGGLEVFLADPDVAIDTNHLERALRVIPMGRKSWLFCWSELGAEYVGSVQSLLTTCVLHGVDPYAYLVDVLQRISFHPQARVEELTPRLWKENFAADPFEPSDNYLDAKRPHDSTEKINDV
jgi:transposase